MRIGEFAEVTGLSKDTIRYYEKINLIQPEIRNKQRDYTEADKETIEMIIKLKDIGFSLNEIKALFDLSKDLEHDSDLSEGEVENLLHIQELFQNKYAELLRKEERIREVKQVIQNSNKKLEYLLEKYNIREL